MLAKRRTTGVMPIGAGLVAGFLLVSPGLPAAPPAATPARAITIPPGTLAESLNTLATQFGLQILFASSLVDGMRAEPLRGVMTPVDALDRLLANTGLRYEFVNPRTVTIVAPRPGPARTSTTDEPAPSGVASAAVRGDARRNSAAKGDVPVPRTSLYSRLLGLFAACSGVGVIGAACADPAPAVNNTGTLDSILVTARKRDELLADVPTSITVFSAATIQDLDIQSFNDYATKVPDLSFTYGTGALGVTESRSVAIRGVSGENVTGTGGAIGFYIDDTPVPASLDPRVLDVADIEVLKGPQGTLYGESSLGGNVRLSTQRPDLATNGVGYMAEVGRTSGAGSLNGGANLIANLPLVAEHAALRVVLFGNHDGGYLTRTYPNPSGSATTDPFAAAPRTSVGNQAAATSYGGSVTALIRATDAVELRLRVMFQYDSYNGFPATFAAGPGYHPNYVLDRAFNVQPHALDRWSLPSLDITYRAGNWHFVSSTSFFHRASSDIEDSTYGTQQVLSGYYGVTGLPAQPYLWRGDMNHNQLTEELRSSFDAVHGLSGTFGVFYANGRSTQSIPPTYSTGLVAATASNLVVGPWPNELLWVDTLNVGQRDLSLFGEIYYHFLDRFDLTLGARQYWLHQDGDYTADGFLNFGLTPSSPTSNSESGLSPKVALSYAVTETAKVYASASKGFRAGGAQTYAPYCATTGLTVDDITHLRSDSLWTYEIGTKVQLPEARGLLSVSVYRIDWNNFHEQVALPCGLNFGINGGKATIEGGEFEVAGHPAPELQLNFGVGYERSRVTDPGALAIVGFAEGARLTGIPLWNMTAGAVYQREIAPGVSTVLAADYSYVGGSTNPLNQSGGVIAARAGYPLANVRFGIERGKTELSLNLRNITNAKPNLGDLGYNGYIQHDAAGAVIPMVATLAPFTVMLQFRKSL